MKKCLVISITILFAIFLFNSCNAKKKLAKIESKELLQDQKLTIAIFPYWGGSANAILERKNGKDFLTNSWVYKEKGVDTTVTSTKSLQKNLADSIFVYAAKIKFNDDINYGTAEPTADMKALVSFRKGHLTKSVEWDRIKGVFELPFDLLQVVKMVNDVSPEDLKLY